MRYTILLAILLAACAREQQKPAEPTEILLQAAIASDMQAVAGPMFSNLKDMLDLAKVQSVTREDNVIIYMAAFKDNPNKIYVASSKGELLYVRRGNTIGLLKDGEAICIEGREVWDISTGAFKGFFTQDMSQEEMQRVVGFCQRKRNQSFGDCYKQEADEFCSSFISCLAINTRPSVHIVIGIACSCLAPDVTQKYTPPVEDNDSLISPYIPDPTNIDL